MKKYLQGKVHIFDSVKNKVLQGVRFNVGISTIGLSSTMLHQNWHDIAHYEVNIPPFEFLSQKSEKYFCMMKKM